MPWLGLAESDRAVESTPIYRLNGVGDDGLLALAMGRMSTAMTFIMLEFVISHRDGGAGRSGVTRIDEGWGGRGDRRVLSAVAWALHLG